MKIKRSSLLLLSSDCFIVFPRFDGVAFVWQSTCASRVSCVRLVSEVVAGVSGCVVPVCQTDTINHFTTFVRLNVFFLFWRLTTFGSPLPFLFTHARLCKMSAQHTEMCVWQTKFKYSDLCVTLNSNKKIIYIVVWSIFSFFVALVLDRQTTAIILICFSSSSFIHCMAGKCLLTADIF